MHDTKSTIAFFFSHQMYSFHLEQWNGYTNLRDWHWRKDLERSVISSDQNNYKFLDKQPTTQNTQAAA